MLNTHKKRIAMELLHESIRLYSEGLRYYACLHLAAAADEVLGSIVEHLTSETPTRVRDWDSLKAEIESELVFQGIFNTPRTTPAEIRRKALQAKNYVKHYAVACEEEISFDPRKEARRHILNAIGSLDVIEVDPGAEIDATEDRLWLEEDEE